VSEVYQGSETAPPAGDAGATAPYDAGSRPASADNTASYTDAASDEDFAGYSDADIDAILAAEDQLPEPRTRQEAAAATWDDSPGDPADDELAAEYDGDVAAFLAAEEQLPEPRTRQEAAAATWDDTTQPGDDDLGSFAGDPAAEHDGDVAAFLAAEDQLPEPRTRQEAAAATWDDTSTSQATEPDTSTGSTSPSQPDTVTEPPARHDEDEDRGAPDLSEHQVAVHTTDGADVPVTVEYLPPEARTVGDTTPTGIGRKPTGEEFLDMESDDLAESSLDKLLRRANEGADDLRDTISNTAETLHDLRLPGPALDGGHAHAGQPVHDSAPPAGPAFSDVTGGVVLVGVALLTGIRHVVRQLGKGDGR
jgi:hypothetical protein